MDAISLTPRIALFLDLDGTLLDLVPPTQSVNIAYGLRSLLHELFQSLDGAVALISGRSIASIDALLWPIVLPAAGQFGAELRMSAFDKIHTSPRSDSYQDLYEHVCQWVKRYPHFILESKPHTMAIQCQHGHDDDDDIDDEIAELIEHHSNNKWRVVKSRQSYDIVPVSLDKTTAIMRFMATEPFRDRVPIFMGDDAMDEKGFQMVNQIGGYSIQVGNHKKKTFAIERFTSPNETRQWLTQQLHNLQCS